MTQALKTGRENLNSGNRESRLSFWDNWKGLAIIAVILIHSASALEPGPTLSIDWHSGVIFRQLIDFAVPLFLSISGYFAGVSSRARTEPGLRDSWSAWAGWMRERLLRIVVPYIVWTVIYLVSRRSIDDWSVAAILLTLFRGDGIFIGYFIVVLCQFVIITPLLSRLTDSTMHASVMAVGWILGASLLYWLVPFTRHPVISPFPNYALCFVVWYPSYHLGYFIGRSDSVSTYLQLRRRSILIAAALAFFASIAEGYFWAYRGDYSFATSQLKISSMLFSSLLFMAIFAYRDTNGILQRRTWLTWLGGASFGIYFMHMLVLLAVLKLSRLAPIAYSSQLIPVFLNATFTLMLCALLVLAVRLILPAKQSVRILGI